MVNMQRKALGLFFLFFVVIFPMASSASLISETLVQEGRSLLFNGGSPSYQGIIDADQKFGSALQEDPNDQYANFFYGITQIAVFILETKDDVGYQSIADIVVAMGVPIHLDSMISSDLLPFGDPPELRGDYNPPEGMPNGDEVGNVFGQQFVAVLDQSLDKFDAIDHDLNVVLTPAETGDISNLEIDYTDILLMKGFLNALKTILLTVSAYDLDGVDIRELIALDNAGMGELHLGFINEILLKYPNLFKLSQTGAAQLTTAKSAFISAYSFFSEAQNTLKLESDTQGNDLFVFESEGDEQEFNGFMSGFSELIDSLEKNRPATSQYSHFEWDVNIQNGDEIHLSLSEEQYGNDAVKHNDSDFWGRIGGIDVFGQVRSWTVNDGTVSMILDYWGGQRILIQGELDQNTNSLTGDCTFQEYDGISYISTGSSYCAANQTTQWSDDVERIDLNLLFGNTGKSQLVLRDALPQFDKFGEPITGTFNAPFFNGILPDFTTNEDVSTELDFDPPYTVFSIPDANINLDGDKSDWPAASLVATDFLEPFMDGLSTLQGVDIKQVYLAKNKNQLFMGIELAGNPMNEPDTNSVFYQLELQQYVDSGKGGRFYTNIFYDHWTSTWRSDAAFYDDFGNNTPVLHSNDFSDIGTGETFIEWTLPIPEGFDIAEFGGYWINFGSWSQSYHQGDWLGTNAKLAPVYTISGTVSIPDGYTGGKIYYYLSDNEWASTADDAFMGTYTDSDGNFILEDLPYSSSPVYLHIFWDKDGNGILNSGDYTGVESFPVQNDVALGDIQLTETVPELDFDYISVMNVFTGGAQSNTWVSVSVGNDFQGSLPGDIDTVVVIAPDGSRHGIWPDGGAEWTPEYNEIWCEIPGPATVGTYTFVVTTMDGSVGIGTDVQKDLFNIPVVNTDSVVMDTSSKTPIFSWDPVYVENTGIAYRFEIRGVDTDFSFKSSRDWNMTQCTSPELEPGKQYQYRIRAVDDSNFIQVDNRSHTQWVTFTMNDTLTHTSVPAIGLDGWGAVEWSSIGNPPGLDLWVKIIDFDGIAYDGSSHTVYARPVDAAGNLIGNEIIQLQRDSAVNGVEAYYWGWLNPDDIPENMAGVRFFSVDPDGNQGVVGDEIKSVEKMNSPQDIGLTCTVNGGTTPTFTWNKVENANYYRIRIYTEDGSSTVLRWNAIDIDHTTIPPGYLEPGKTYQYRLEARDNHWGFDTDETIVLTQKDESNKFPQFTTGILSEEPFIYVSSSGVSTWNNDSLGIYTNFWVEVYDAQGADNISSVRVTHPDGVTETQLFYQYKISDNHFVYSSDSFDSSTPQSGTYSFVATDKDGNQSLPVAEVLDVNPIGYPDEASISALVVNDTGVEFDWEDVDGAAFYRVEIYNKERQRIYKLATTESRYSLAPGFLKQGEVYSFRITTRREFFDDTTDNASTTATTPYDNLFFKTGPVDIGGTNPPLINIMNIGAAVTYLTHPISGQPLYWLQFSIRVFDADGVPGNIKSATVRGPGIQDHLSLEFEDSAGDASADYWARLVYDAYDDVPEGLYTFRVEDEDGNSYETTDLLTKQPVPLAENLTPENGSIVSNNKPVIAWTNPEEGSYFYRVSIFQNADGKEIHNSGILSTTSYVVPEQILQPGQLYRYRVYVSDTDMRSQDMDNVSIQGVYSPSTNRFSVTDAQSEMGLMDAFKILNILTGNTSLISSFSLDVNADSKMDLKDTVPILQEAGEMR